jgi:pimeloyl-ACP methyl ester carboxylesterase
MRQLVGVVIVCGAMAIGLSGCGATARSVAAAPGARYTYVVCHGATAGGWEWKQVDHRLRADGHTMYRPTYTGLGERAHLAKEDVDLDTHITDIVNVIRFEDLHDVVLVGHSYGGMVMTGVADRVPDRVKAMVYVDAMVPQNGESVADLRLRRGDATNPATTRSAMFDGKLGEPLRPGSRNITQPPRTRTQPIRLTHASETARIPVVYILTVDPGKRAEDDPFYFSSQRAKDRGWTVWEMSADHVPCVSRPAELTDLLEDAPSAARASRP